MCECWLVVILSAGSIMRELSHQSSFIYWSTTLDLTSVCNLFLDLIYICVDLNFFFFYIWFLISAGSQWWKLSHTRSPALDIILYLKLDQIGLFRNRLKSDFAVKIKQQVDWALEGWVTWRMQVKSVKSLWFNALCHQDYISEGWRRCQRDAGSSTSGVGGWVWGMG